ncbi:Guanylate kinase [Lachnospiraceae bacterium TWA4]|nr:Guanylate kinase [Lachnospiraceae bacterium TWA4]
MGIIYYLMGKSASGKDTIYSHLLERTSLRQVVPYTTRPIRSTEKEGVQYHFVTEQDYQSLKEEGKVIEDRVYQTAHGPWRYFTVNDGQIRLDTVEDYLMIGTLEAYKSLCDYFGKEHLVPLYIEVDDGIRLQRALDRERSQKIPKYEEMCRRFLADQKDFSEEHLKQCEITKKYKNYNLEECLKNIQDQLNGNRR